jgi:hypothetical protein
MSVMMPGDRVLYRRPADARCVLSRGHGDPLQIAGSVRRLVRPTPAIPSALDPALGDTGVDNAVLSSGIR